MIIKDVVILAACRTPVGVLLGALRQVPAPLLLSALVGNCLLDTPKSLISSAVFASCVQAHQGLDPVKQALSMNSLEHTPTTLINSGHSGALVSLILASRALMLGDQVVLCGGFDSSSTAPHVLPGRQGWASCPSAEDELPKVYLNDDKIHFGLAIEEIVVKEDMPRAFHEDYFNHARTRRKVMQKLNYFDKEIVKLDVLGEDELGDYRETSSIRPLFYSTGTVTSFTAAVPADGAVALKVARKSVAASFGLKPLVSVVACWAGKRETRLVDSLAAGVKSVLEAYGIGVHNVGIWEVNDFFAVLPALFCRHLKVGMEKVNVAGGNLVIGDTLAASSGRGLVTASVLMHEKGLEFGVVVSVNCSSEVTVVLLKSEK